MDLAIAFCITLTVLATVLSLTAVFWAVKTHIDLKAMQKSTHKIEWRPMDLKDVDLNRALDTADDQAMRQVDDIHNAFEGLM